ncbi:MAG: tyrosine-type recombinase/integrase, partial [Elusimicrobia bacterium]|nr:tyrosine-type recombinase/integrase [Elusimicrobiota bacterium]
MSETALAIQSLTAETLSWPQAFNLFQLRGRAEGHSPATSEHYRWTLGQAVEFFKRAGADKPCAVSSVHVKQFLDDRRATGMSSSTLQTRFRHLRTFFRALVSDGILTKDPTEQVSTPKIETKPPKAFSLDNFAAVLERVDLKKPLGKRDVALFCLVFDSGARVSEVLSLSIKDLDLSQNMAQVRGKGGRFRSIAWGERTRRAVLDWLRCRPEAKPEDPAFCDKFGGMLSRGAVRQRLKRLTKKAGIAAPRLAVHALRHGCA